MFTSICLHILLVTLLWQVVVIPSLISIGGRRGTLQYIKICRTGWALYEHEQLILTLNALIAPGVVMDWFSLGFWSKPQTGLLVQVLSVWCKFTQVLTGG